MISIVDYYIRSNNFSFENNEDSKQLLNVEANIGYAVWGYENNTIALIEDVFSETSEVKTTISSISSRAFNDSVYFSDRQNLVIDTSGSGRMDEIISVQINKSNVEQIISEKKLLNIKGNLFVNIYYKNYDNEEILNSQELLPYELKVNNMPAEEDNNLIYNAFVCARVNSVKNKAGQELGVLVDFEGQIFSQGGELESYLCNIEESDEKIVNSCSIVVYMPSEKESVFEIAKSLKVSPDIILSQNPQLEEGKAKQKVVVYKKSK